MNKLEFIENDQIITYQLKIDKNRRGNLKNKLKKLGIEKEIEVNYDAYFTSAQEEVLERNLGDEFLGFSKEKITVKSPKTDAYHIKYGAPIHTSAKVKVKKYPLLYHILFGNYRLYNQDILETIKLYLSNNYGIKDQNHKELFDVQKRMQKIKGEPLEIIYDNHLSFAQKKELIEEFLETITYQLINRESLQKFTEQIEVVSSINIKSEAKTALIEEMKTRLLTAQKNTKNLEILNKMLNVNTKKLQKKNDKKTN